MKKFSFLVAIALLVCITFAAVAEGQKEKNVVEIKWLLWWTAQWRENLANIIADFEKEHPNIKVTRVDTTWADIAAKMEAAAAGGLESYDVVAMEDWWIYSLSKKGYLEALDPLLQKEPQFANKLTSDTPRTLFGKTYALALYLVPYHFGYNVEVFEQKGLQPPNNWDEFVKVLEKLRDPATGSYGMSMPLSDGEVIMTRYFGFRLAQEGGQWLSKDGSKVIFNSPEGVAALKWWVDFYKKGLVVPGSMGEDQNMMSEFLATGQTSAIIDGWWIPETVRGINPGAEVKFAYGPPWKAKTGGYSVASTGLSLVATGKHKNEAWEFMKYMYSDKVSTEFAKKINYVWATKAGLAWLKDSSDPFLKWVPALLNQDSGHNVLYPVLPEGTKLQDAFKLAFQEALSGKKDPKTALDEAAKVWQKELDATKTK